MNEASPASLEVGQYYARKRAIPPANTLRIRTGAADTVTRGLYQQQIEAPIARWLARNSSQDSILYIVLTKGIPLRIEGSTGPQGTVASVDSELTLLYRKMAGETVLPAGPIHNPYFLGETPLTRANAFTRESHDIYLVSRLDGYTTADIRGLIDRGSAPSRNGKILLDGKESVADKGNAWLGDAAEILKGMGFQSRVVQDQSGRVLAGEQGVLGYYSWGSNDPAIRIRRFDFGFVPGALAGMFVSTDGRTFSEPPADWKIGSWEDRSTHFAGSPQSMAGDLIREGVTGIAGHVAEPYLESAIRPYILFPAYLSGFNLIESFYMAMPYLSWQTVVVGDPLCAPFRTASLSPGEIDRGIDPATEMPVFFGARQALEEATSRDGSLVAAQLQLAMMYEQSEDYGKAMAGYRRVLELTPDNQIALNNLAYALAVRENALQEALNLAERAYGLARTNPEVIDTLGWILHLMGENEKAVLLLEEAVRLGAQSAEIHLHLAIVRAALGSDSAAEAALLRALELDKKLDEREAVRELRTRIKMRN